ncbi:hypothetical protein ACQB6R_10070 [Propionibacteriaceae bacterium G1746]|uniref:hypothetical protein n=1 Tax=Aestuariimicrobium sp. G57 TaxID=3418485 RepID=UPI003C25AD98
MGGPGVSMPVLLVLGVGAFLAVVLRRRQVVNADPQTHPHLMRLARRSARAKAFGLGVGAAVALLVAVFVGDYGRGLLLAPTVLALGLAVSLFVGEVLVWREARTPGVAALETRRPSAHLPRVLLGTTIVAVLVLAGLLGWARDHQDNDPASMTRGRGYLQVFPSGWTISSPFPGDYYSMPLVWLGLAALLVAGVTLVVIALRPRNGSDPQVVAVDDVVRRRNAEATIATVLLGACGSLVPVALLMAIAVGRFNPTAGWLLVLVAALGIVGVGWAAAVLLVPDGGRRD